eukprot:4781535-Prymnesium_polylepis.2
MDKLKSKPDGGLRKSNQWLRTAPHIGDEVGCSPQSSAFWCCWRGHQRARQCMSGRTRGLCRRTPAVALGTADSLNSPGYCSGESSGTLGRVDHL